MTATPAVTSKVVQFGAGPNQGRACSFRVDELEVLVRPHDCDQNDRALELANEILEFVKPRPIRLIGVGCVRFDEKGRIWCLSNREKGWSAFGYQFDSWDELFRRFDVRVTSHGVDDLGPWWGVESAPGVTNGR